MDVYYAHNCNHDFEAVTFEAAGKEKQYLNE